VLHLFCTVDTTIPTDKNGKLKTENPWKTSLACMANPAALLANLEGFKEKIDQEVVPANNFKAIRPQLADPNFTPAIIRTKSSCAGGLCDWVINITMYYDVVVTVEPKKAAVRAAQERLAAANAKKAEMDELVATLNAALAVLQAQFQKAMDEKNAAEAEAARCARRLDSAQRLVGALGSESERWNQAIVDLGEKLIVITGDVLLASAFVSYVGPFNKKFRDMITNVRFLDFFRKMKIPMSPDTNPLSILTDEATIAGWNN
jgi:dynein heavy chain